MTTQRKFADLQEKERAAIDSLLTNCPTENVPNERERLTAEYLSGVGDVRDMIVSEVEYIEKYSSAIHYHALSEAERAAIDTLVDSSTMPDRTPLLDNVRRDFLARNYKVGNNQWYDMIVAEMDAQKGQQTQR